MTDQHLITPPPELVEQWHSYSPLDRGLTLATKAAQWGADQELEALMSWLRSKGFDHMANDLLAARRPKPPSLKEQALEKLTNLEQGINPPGFNDYNTIRRALESIND